MSSIRVGRRRASVATRASWRRAPQRFAHPTEEVFAALLSLYGLAWAYEPIEFPLAWNDAGRADAGVPARLLPRERDLFIELTVLEQRLVTKKNQKVRRVPRALPRGRPARRLPARLLRAARAARPGRTCPTSRPRVTVVTDRRPFLYDRHVELGAKIVPFGGWEMPLAYAAGTVAEHLACRRDAVVFDVSHLGTVRCDGPGMFDALQSTLTNDLTQGRTGPGAVHAPAERGRVRRRRHHRVVGGRGRAST